MVLQFLKRLSKTSNAKIIQSEIDELKQTANKKTCNEICSRVLQYSRLNVKKPLDLRNCYLEQARFNGLKIFRVCFWNTELKNSDFSNARLSWADFWKANLSGANFSNANLTNCVFTQTNLQGATFAGANLKNARLEEANLKNADLTNANLQWSRILLRQLKTVKSLKNAIMPDGTKFSADWQKAIDDHVLQYEDEGAQ